MFPFLLSLSDQPYILSPFDFLRITSALQLPHFRQPTKNGYAVPWHYSRTRSWCACFLRLQPFPHLAKISYKYSESTIYRCACIMGSKYSTRSGGDRVKEGYCFWKALCTHLERLCLESPPASFGVLPRHGSVCAPETHDPAYDIEALIFNSPIITAISP